MEAYKKIIGVAAVIVILWAVHPLFGLSYIPTHDGEYHIVRIVEFSRMLQKGNIFPRWAPDMNGGYGIPIFNYHYPLPNYIGSFVRLFTRDAVYAFQWSQGLGYIVLAGAAYLWLSALFGPFPAMIGSVVAAFVPYVFVDMYVRGTIGEVWALAFVMFTLYAFEKKRYPLFAAAYGMVILSHNIMAMIFTPFILAYGLIRNRNGVKWMLGGLGMSAFFWIPAITESKYVVGLNTVAYRDHFVQLYQLLIPSWGTQFSGSGSFGNEMSVQIGIAPLFVIAGGLIAARRVKNNLKILFGLAIAASIFLMLSVSEPIWRIIKPLQLIQYPWRLLSFVIPVAGFFAAYWVSRMRRKWIGLIIAAFAVVCSVSYTRPVLYQPRNEAHYLSRPNFTKGTSSMGNSFSTVWTGWKDEMGPAPASDVRLTMASESAVNTHTLYFPGWKAFIDGRNVPIINDAGIITVTVPAGSHTLSLKLTETPVRRIADIITFISIGALIVL